MKRIAIYLFLVAIMIYGCNTISNSGHKKTDPLMYELVASWPQLSQGYTLSQPTGIGVDSKDHVFVFHRTGRKWTNPFPDSLISMNTILELENETGKILTSWGAYLFIMPHGLTVDKEDNIWVTDVALHQVFKFNHSGQLLMTLGIAKVSGNDSLHFFLPTDVAVDDDGSFYVSDGYGNSRVVKFNSAGKYILEWGTKGTKPGEFDIPHAIDLDKSGHVFVADRQNNRIQVFDRYGKFIKELKNNETVAQLPALTIDNEQNLFAIDYDFNTIPDTLIKGSTIFKYDSSDRVLFHFGATGESKRTPSWFHDISVDKQGNVYVGDIMGMKVLKFKIK
ncbi:MAG: peptidyl-alpha-hydroxyglycine alpha-amidating lyase family protein [Saprospiraceae bacterium]